MLAAVPERSKDTENAIKRELTLVIDRSGSMRGKKLAQAKEAAMQVIAGLKMGESFNVILYSNNVESFSPQPVVKTKATEAQADKMFWAIDRFRDSGLELPSLEVHFAEGCQERFGAWGRIKLDSAPPWRVEVCTTAVYLHELAHAWDRWNLTDTDRRVFLDLRGLEAWQGKDILWKERGQEELASLVARVLGQGVNNHPSAEQLTDFRDFEQITGVPVPVVRTVDPSDPQSEAPAY